MESITDYLEEFATFKTQLLKKPFGFLKIRKIKRENSQKHTQKQRFIIRFSTFNNIKTVGLALEKCKTNYVDQLSKIYNLL